VTSKLRLPQREIKSGQRKMTRLTEVRHETSKNGYFLALLACKSLWLSAGV
jgi:hypothetical protein